MHTIEWLCCRWSLVTTKHVKPPQFLSCIALCIFVIGDRKDYKFDVKVECASHSLRTTNCSWLGRGQVMWPITKFWVSNHITGMAEHSLQILYTSRQYQFYATELHITNKMAWLWSRDCFKILPLVVMHRDALVCQRQLSYLLLP